MWKKFIGDRIVNDPNPPPFAQTHDCRSNCTFLRYEERTGYSNFGRKQITFTVAVYKCDVCEAEFEA